MSEETIETVETVETPHVEAEKPVIKAVRAKKPEIRDHEDAILELRKENERLRKSLDDVSEEKAQKLAEERIAKAKEEARADAQRLLDERLAEMEKQSKLRVMKAELKAQATRAGVIDFDDLYQIMQRDVIKKVEFNDDGDVLNAGELIAELKQNKPHLFQGVNTSSIASVPPAVSPKQTQEKVALSMSPQEYERAKRKLYQL